MKVRLIPIIKSWLPLAAAITLICGIVYTVAQQLNRQSANDPQIEMAQDAAAALARGMEAESLVVGPKADIAMSLAPYLIIFDEAGKPVVSSGVLDGRIPSPPIGVFDYTRQNRQDILTWQPRPGIRSATVVRYFSGARTGFVLAGRSLFEVENRIDKLMIGIAFGWLFTIISTLIVVLIIEHFTYKER
jgi:hypothetical protein